MRTPSRGELERIVGRVVASIDTRGPTTTVALDGGGRLVITDRSATLAGLNPATGYEEAWRAANRTGRAEPLAVGQQGFVAPGPLPRLVEGYVLDGDTFASVAVRDTPGEPRSIVRAVLAALVDPGR